MIERERLSDERDGLRYYVETDKGFDPNKILFQRWFHCKDLGKELGPIIKSYFASDQHKTGGKFIRYLKYKDKKDCQSYFYFNFCIKKMILFILLGVPSQDDINNNPSAWKEDKARRVEEPFNLKSFLNMRRENIIAANETNLFDPTIYKTDVKLLGHGQGKNLKQVLVLTL